jgi:tetratricopeptide (TPR) repeat protein
MQVAYWTRRIACHPCDAEAYSKRAEARAKMDSMDEALSDLAMAIRLEPQRPVYYTQRAELLLCMKRNGEALGDLDKALEIDPHNNEARMLRGIAGLAANVPVDQAMNDLSLAAQQEDEGFSSWLIQLRGLQHMKQGEYAEAIADFTQCLEHGDDDPTARAGTYLLRGSAYTESKQYDRAIDDYTKIIDLIPGESWGYISRAGVYLSMGDKPHAMADYATVMDRWPGKSYGYAQKAWALATSKFDAIRDGRSAVKLATHACELEPSNRFVMQVRAAAYAEQGDFERAIEWQEKAIAAYDAKREGSTEPSKSSQKTWTITIIGPPSKESKKQEAVVRLESYRQNKPLRQ